MGSSSSKIKSKNSAVGIQSQGGTVNVAGNVIVHQGSSQKHIELELEEFTLPRLIDTFRGRDEELKKIESLLFGQNTKKVVICGLPGMGKSELAKQFAEECKKNGKVDYVIWVKAENKEDLEQSSRQLKSLYQNLNKYKCLFIFDNMISRKYIFDLEPPQENNYYLLITSQVKDWHDDVKSLELNYLKSDSANEVFKIILNKFYNEADYALYLEIAKVVNNIPLGLQVTAAYVRQRMKSAGQYFDLQQYVDEIKRNQHTYIDLVIPECIANPYTKSLYRAVKISIDYIKNEKNFQIRELALNVMFVCAFLDPEEITLFDLLKMPNIKELLTQYKKDDNTLREALSLIDNYSIIIFYPNANEIKLHRLIQEILRFHQSTNDLEMQSTCYEACLEVLFIDINLHGFVSYNYKYTNILKYADSNIVTFFKFYHKHKKELFVNHDGDILKYILSWLIKWNCIKTLKEILNDINKRNWFNLNMCIRQCICLRACTCKYIFYFELLHDAATYNNVEAMMQLLLEYDFNINNRDFYHDTPLHTAARYGNFESITFLIENNADLNARNCLGEIPLFTFLKCVPHGEYNILLNNVNEILGLFEIQENKITRNYCGETLVHAAAGSCNADLVTLLVSKYKCDVNVQGRYGYTPLHSLINNAWLFSKKQDVIRITEVLKTYGARLDIKDWSGRTPQQFAQEKEIEYLVSYLEWSPIS